MHLLRPSANALRTVAPQLGHAFTVGAVNLAAATALNTRLAESSQALEEFAQNPVVPLAFEDFTQTLEIGNPLLAGIAPEQANCNYWTLAFRNLASLESENIGVGTLARAGTLLVADGPQQRGLPGLGARQRPRHRKRRPWQLGRSFTTTTCTTTPTRTSPAPASATCAKRATRTTCRAPL